MDKTLVLFVAAVTVIAVISSIFLVWYVIRRKQKKQEPVADSKEQNGRKDVSLWIFLIVFGLIFSIIPVTGLLIQTVSTQDWVETPAVISEMRIFKSDSERKQHIFVSYEFKGRTYENISTNTSVKETGLKNPTKVGQKIIVLVNPNNPSQILAYSNFYYTVLFALLLVGLLLCFTGIYNLIKTRAGKSKWRAADEAPVVLTEEEERKSRIGGKIFGAAIFMGILLFIYFMASFPVFLFFVAWMLFLAVYGMYRKHKKKK